MIGMKKIAQEADVSQTTVSFVLNGCSREKRISAEVERRVLETANRLGYVKNELVRSAMGHRSGSVALIALLYDDLMPMLDGFCAAATKYSYTVRILSAYQNIPQVFQTAISYRVEGIFAANLRPKERSLIHREWLRNPLPEIGITSNPLEQLFDYAASAETGIKYLISLGHRKIVCFTDQSENALKIQNGYEKILHKHHLKAHYFQFKSNFRTASLADYDDLINAHPDAVFCVSDVLAFDLLRFLYSQKIFVPDTFSVLGFGAWPGINYSSPPLSSISDKRYECGWRAFENLLRQLEPNKLPPSDTLLTGELVIRKSIKKIKTEVE